MNSYALEVAYPSGKPKTVPLHRFPFRLGRDPTNDLPLADRSVSRHHAFIRLAGRQLRIVDNQSRNGVLVNDEIIAGEQELQPGDRITIGPYLLRLALTTRTAADKPAMGKQGIDFFDSLVGDPVVHLTAGFAPQKARDTLIPWRPLLHLLVRGTSEALYTMVMEVVAQVVEFDRCFLILFANRNLDTMEIVAARFGPTCQQESTSEVYVSRSLLRHVADTGEPIAITDRETSLNVKDSFIRSGARSVLCIPIVTEVDVLGVLYVDRLLDTRPFHESVVKQLSPLMALVSLKLENLRLVDDRVQAELNRRELEIAQSVQRNFIPHQNVDIPGYAFDAYNHASRYVGGDCLDFFLRPNGNLTFAIGDVTGKGLPAALYMVGVLSTLSAHMSNGDPLDVVMSKLEQYVRTRFSSDHFLSLFLAELNVRRGMLTYCNAGHIPPSILAPNGRTTDLPERGPALNITTWDTFSCAEHALAPGDLLFVYTDGLVEKRDEAGNMYGTERLLESIRVDQHRDLKLIRQSILAQLRSFGPSPAAEDDIAFILLRRTVDTGGTDGH
jgi:sigma-B regulation protein RsbU (phosphoserine phosphatase)